MLTKFLTKKMKNDKLAGVLEELGLNEKEAKVYLGALSLGPTTVFKISQTAEIKRTTVYSILESLKKQGLIRIEIKGFKKLYAAENPEKLESMINNRRELLNKTLPEFAALYNLQGGGSLIKYYEGWQASKAVFLELLKEVKPHDDYLVITDQQKWYELDPKFFQKFIEKRAKLNLKIHLLFQDSKIARYHKKLQKNFNEKIKILPKRTDLTTNLIILPHKVVIHQLISPYIAIVIENKSVVKMCREMFEIIWRSI